MLATQRDLSSLRELRAERVERFDAGGIMRPSPPGTAAYVNTSDHTF